MATALRYVTAAVRLNGATHKEARGAASSHVRGITNPSIRDALTDLLGKPTYLCHWMRESGLADLLPSLSETVWVGVSAGSIVIKCPSYALDDQSAIQVTDGVVDVISEGQWRLFP